ncbi:hypothetical protein ES703_113112 [subsurface metagenome]
MNIIRIPIIFVKFLLRSKIFLIVAIALILILWLVKFDLKKVWQVLKLLTEFAVNLLALFLRLTFHPLVKFFDQEAKNA